MSECNHDCGSCSANYDSRKADKGELLGALNSASSIKRVVGVISGKGGVGKSLVTSMLAVSMNRKDKKTAALSADIIGPPIPMAFGIGSEGVATSPDGSLILPTKSMEDMGVMSASLPLNRDTDPVTWRGPVIMGAVKQFWSETLWQDMDYMFTGMSSGTGNVPLTVFQSSPVGGIIITALPRGLVGMIVAEAVNMAKKMDAPIMGVAENVSYLEYLDCGKHISVPRKSHIEEIVTKHGTKVLAQIPIGPVITQMMDAGRMECLKTSRFGEAVKAVEALQRAAVAVNRR